MCRKVVRGNLFHPQTIPGEPVFGHVSYECFSPNMRSFTTRETFYSTAPDVRMLDTSRRQLLTLPRHLRRLGRAGFIEAAPANEGESELEGISEGNVDEDEEERDREREEEFNREREEEELTERLDRLEQEAGSIREYLSRRGQISRRPSRGRRRATLWSASNRGMQ